MDARLLLTGGNAVPCSLVHENSEEVSPSSSVGDLASTKRSDKLLTVGSRIATEPPDDDDLQFMHSTLCQLGLPRSKVEGTVFERRSGRVALLVEAGRIYDGKQYVQQPLPYGALPRLILAWMNTYAVRNDTTEIPVGDSASEFLELLGKHANGGIRGSLTMFRNQIQALSACHITLGYTEDDRAHTVGGTPITGFEAWISTSAKQRALWPRTVTFHEKYFKDLKLHAVPLDLRAYMALKGSSLSMDVYTWLAHRLYRIKGRPVPVYWANLREQFGHEYEGKNQHKNFKKSFLQALSDVQVVYPKATVKRTERGFLLVASPPPIAPKES